MLAVGCGAEAQQAADELMTLLALVEAGIDFSDADDVVAISGADLRRRMLAVAATLDSLAGHARPRSARVALPTIALFGEPNAGKSTLFNALLGRPRALVSSLAGTTRDALLEPLRTPLGTPLIWPNTAASVREPFAMLMDLPGVSERESLTGPESLAQATSKNAIEAANVLVWCDPTGRFDGPGPLQLAPGNSNGHSSARVIRVRTKADLRALQPLPNPLATGARGPDIEVCAVDGRNLDQLAQMLEQMAWAVESSLGATGLAALLPQHRQAAAKAAGLTRTLCEQVEDQTRVLRSPELVAAQLRESLSALAPLTGRVHPDDIVGRIFGMFCIGK